MPLTGKRRSRRSPLIPGSWRMCGQTRPSWSEWCVTSAVAARAGRSRPAL